MTIGFSEAIAAARCLRPLEPEIWRAASAERLKGLAQALASPTTRVSAADLAALFNIDTVTVTARRPRELQDYPEFAVRVRGAMGRILHALGPPVTHRKDYGARPRAWDVLFETMGRSGQRAEIPKPFTLRAAIERNQVVARGSLVGIAGFWTPDVATALVGALEGGVTLADTVRTRARIECLNIAYGRVAGFEPPAGHISEARLQFRTPVRVRTGNATMGDCASLMIALLNRVARLAAWQFLGLDIDWSVMHQAARTATYDDRGLYPVHWTRGSRRQGGRIPVLGLMGRLIVRGRLDPLVPFLQIGEYVHVGSHAALGLGAYDLVLLP